MSVSPACKACNSTQRAEIDRRLLEGETTRSVSSWLELLGETISYVSLSRHLSAHCQVREQALARLEEARPVHTAAVEKIVAQAELLDEIASVAMAIVRAAKEDKPESKEAVSLFVGCMREVRGCVVARFEMLHGKKVKVEMDGLADLLARGFEPE